MTFSTPTPVNDSHVCHGMVGCAMELYPVRYVFGFPELLWSLRQWGTRRRAVGWARISATVEGYELLQARQNGWFVVFYSFGFGGNEYSGELRTWILFGSPSHEVPTSKIIHWFPRGAAITVRVDPQKPSELIAEQ